jgi:hypothetical protein
MHEYRDIHVDENKQVPTTTTLAPVTTTVVVTTTMDEQATAFKNLWLAFGDLFFDLAAKCYTKAGEWQRVEVGGGDE